MKIGQIVSVLGAKVLCGGDKLDKEINAACAADMMSEVLSFVKDQGMLLTGLTNPQAVRTAEMMDMSCVAFVRGKVPDASVIELAEEKGIILLATQRRMFESCGLLYAAGLQAGSR